MHGTSPTFSSREFLRMIEAQGLTGTWSWVFATGAQAWSPGLYDILGFEPGSVQPDYTLLRALAHPDDRPSLEEPGEIARTGILGDHTIRIVRRDGTMRALATRGEVFHAPDGRPMGAVGVVLDVTDRERLGRAQMAEQRRRHALARQARIFTFTETVVPFCEYGPEFLEMTGLRREEIAENWLAPVVPEEWAQWREQMPPLYAAGQPFTVTPTLRLAGGERVPFRQTLIPTRDAAGAVESWTMVMVPTDTVAPQPETDLGAGLEQAIEGRHLRAARALLDWSMADLARASGLSFSTVRRLEENADGPAARSRQTAIATLRAAGISFTVIEGNAIALTRAD
ncbi:PAS domain-containing protein [Methylobacterium planeticum]|uniref:histidine kinase n=1 Tax=Methylobacterium planeticum TaxID=2615211 RepID=A0A6N6ML83_9HYPH|nr:PAS domain-containing protein [Methylobacterium planeticum]KAB1070482.1 PAS domain-containing protein [Methylobacterium planeticum]